jgi:hypothetical protein
MKSESYKKKGDRTMEKKTVLMSIVLMLVVGSAVPVLAGDSAGKGSHTKKVLWGDTHLHTSYSPDAYLMQNRTADPDTAYRYAKGLPVVHPYHRARIQIGTPLDFLVVSDHGEYMGVLPSLFKGDPMLAETKLGKKYLKMFEEGREIEVFSDIIRQVNTLESDPEFNSEKVNRTIWGQIMDAAERHYEPGKFTTFLGWEWSSTPEGANLHRVIFMREGKQAGVQFIPFTSFDSANPEDLWKWLEETSERSGSNFVAIPHNSNISKGLMFPIVDSYGKLITSAYADTRMRWEPVVEMTQIKGDSETHPTLSPTDEFADFETFEHLIEVGEKKEVSLFGEAMETELTTADREDLEKHQDYVAKAGDYARSALKRGLAIEARIGSNPYKFGMIGSTDSHTAMASAEENNFHGKMALDSTPESKSKDIIPGMKGNDMGAAGLVAVWAEENTRESIFDAFRRKEVYASSGPRIKVRFFGGWDYESKDTEACNLAEVGYKKGVPMGGDLTKAPEGKAPTFIAAALKDPVEANLDRIQIVKGWVDDKGEPHEKVYNLALSGGRKGARDGKVKPVGNTVDIKTATYTNTIGAAQLCGVWTDPDFKPNLRAFYYVRVLQIPTPRHSLYDAVALNTDPPEGYPATIQERAYTSPIWYTAGK